MNEHIDDTQALATTAPSGRQLTKLQDLAERASARAARALAANTRRAYDAQWRRFVSWCDDNNLESLPADGRLVALYLTSMDEEGLSVATMGQALAAITKAHKAADQEPPRGRALDDVWAGIRRDRGVEPERKAPIMAEDLARMVAAIEDDGAMACRDRALLLVGFAGGFRRSELGAIEVGDLEWSDRGVLARVRRSKTNPLGREELKPIPNSGGPGLLYAAALRDWLRVAGIESGPVFRPINRHGQVRGSAITGRSIARVIKRRAAAVGIDPTRVAGHSLRSGLVSSARAAGKPDRAIKGTTGHKTDAMLEVYDRRRLAWEDAAAADLL